MVRNIVVFGGNSHPQLNETICAHLGMPAGSALLTKFSVGETRVEIKESVRGKDVYIIQSGGGKVNDHLMELLIMISACKTASAKKVTAVLPLFPYSRQSDIPYNKTGAPLTKATTNGHRSENSNGYTFESTPPTPHPNRAESQGLHFNHADKLHKSLAKAQIEDQDHTQTPNGSPQKPGRPSYFSNGVPKRSETIENLSLNRKRNTSSASLTNNADGSVTVPVFQPQPGYKQWVAQAGTLVADLLTCAGADHIITMDLHDPQYQGFFDIPVDNLYGRPLIKKYIQQHIPDYKHSVIVSPDAGGAKRATAIADSLGIDFALIHKVNRHTAPKQATSTTNSAPQQERRPTKITDRQNATMMLVGDVMNRTVILVDDLVDTANTITRAAKLLKKEGAATVYALITHGVLSGDAIDRINASALDKVIVTNSVDQTQNKLRCPKLNVLEIGHVFAEVRCCHIQMTSFVSSSKDVQS